MSRSYLRNGTPIGEYKVYAIAIRDSGGPAVFELNPHGISDYEDLDGLVMMETLSGSFGYDHERIVITKPGANLEGANLEDANLIRANLYGANLSGANLIRANLNSANLEGAILKGANLRGAYYPTGDVPEGWRRTKGHLTKA